MCEPNLGLRFSIAAEVLEDAMRNVAGQDVVAIDKLEFNGFWAGCQTVWGSEVDVNELTVALPLEKRVKAMYTVFDEVYDPGNRCVPLVELQRLQGSCNHWSELQPALKPYSRAISGLARGHSPDRLYLDPPPAAWRRFWGAVDALRAWVAVPESSPQRFVSPMSLLLTPADRIAFDAARGRAPLHRTRRRTPWTS